MVDVVLEFIPEVLEHALNRHCRGISQCTDGASKDAPRHITQQLQIP
jgi:hypothetical protein